MRSSVVGLLSLVAQILASVLVGSMGLSGCVSQEQDKLFPLIQRVNSREWSTDEPIGAELLLSRPKHRAQIVLGVRFDNRVEQLSSALELRLSRGSNYLFVDTLQVAFAAHPGRRPRLGTTMHEQITSPSKALTIPATGIYRLSIRPLDSIALRGVVAVGARVVDIDS